MKKNAKEQSFLSAAPDALRKLTDILASGAPAEFATSFHLSFLEIFDDSLRVGVSVPAGPQFVVWISPASDKPCYARIGDFNVSFEGDADTQAAQPFIDRLAGVLGGLAIKQLLETLSAGAAAPNSPPAAFTTEAERREAVQRRIADAGEWGYPNRWRNFLLDKEIERSLLSSDAVTFSPDSCVIHHTDIECLYVIPPSTLRLIEHTNSFWGTRIRESADVIAFTDLNERDIVFGGTGKLNKLLDALAKTPGKSLAALTCCCVPMITSDDINAAVTDFSAGNPALVLQKDQLEEFLDASLGALARDVFRNAKPASPAPNSFNLAGFASDRSTIELTDILLRAGLSPNVRLFPDIGADVVTAYPNATLQVFFPLDICNPLYDALESLPMKTLRPDPPYGVRLSVAWLRAVAGALGAADRIDPALDVVLAPVIDEWNALKSRAAAFRLGIVVDSEQLDLLPNPSKFTGVPLLPVIEEMGFGVTLLVHRANRKETPDLSSIRNLLENPEHLDARFFSTPAQLRTLLSDPGTHAYLSGHFFDTRLTRAGKSHFSLGTFEMGLQGAVRTLHRLLAACRLPFYRDYARFLPPQNPPLTRKP